MFVRHISHILTLTVILMTTVILSGCNTNKNDSNVSTDKISISQLQTVTSESTTFFNNIPNLTAVEDLQLLLPSNINEVYSYISNPSQEYNMEKYYNDFVDLFSYLFPNHKMNNDYFLYWGGSSRLEYNNEGNITKNLNRVQDNYGKLINGDEGRVYFIYDESWFQDFSDWNSQVCLESGNPMGYGFITINKGMTIELGNIRNTDPATNKSIYPRLESFNPSEYLEKIGSYSPDSTESFKLSDKEMKIVDAVAVYEQYINSLPYPEEKNCNTVVRSVDVYKVTNDIYGFYFNTNKEYKGVQFDYMPNETLHSEYDGYTTYWGFGFMVKSDDVDIVGAAYSLGNACDVEIYKDVIGLEYAANIIGNKMSNNVVFEVESVELVYTSVPKTDENGFIDVEDQSFSNTPSWKFTMKNPNDKLTYVAYVNAADGENFRYYKIFA